MANPYKLTLNTEGVKALLLSDAVETACLDTAADLLQTELNANYHADSHKGTTRASANVASDSVEEYYRNLRGNVVLKALGRYAARNGQNYSAASDVPATPSNARKGKQVQSYTRTLKSGKVITVKAYRRRK